MPVPRVNSQRSAPAGRRERRRVEIHDRLYSAALQLFAERGYLETTVEDITEAADVGKGTFFNYFPTKEHVLATFGAERIAVIERALERARKGPVLPVLAELTGNLVGQSRESPALLRAIFAAHASCAPVRAEFGKRLETARGLMQRIFVLAQESGEIRRDLSAAELARLVQIVFLGVAVAWSLDPDSSLRRTSEGVWNLIVPNLVVRGRQRRAPTG